MHQPATLAGMPPRKSQAPVIHPFDTLYGTETGGLIPGARLKTGHPHDRHNTAYHGTAPSLFHQLMERWRESWTPVPPEDYSFIDIGAGKGRSTLLAAQMHFRQVIGVELNPDLAAIGKANVELFRARAKSPLTLTQADILMLPFPEGPMLLYLFNPFSSTVFRRLLKRLDARQSATPTPVDILYVNDEQRAVLEKHPPLHEVWAGDLHLSEEDDAADRATIQRDAKGLYAVEGYERCSIWRWREE